MPHRTLRRIAATTLALTVLGATLPATAAPTDVVLPDLVPCPGEQAVTVVVDLTDLGGEVETGCATAGTTGTEALVEAGFADTRDGAGMICAIAALPDPCPAEFTGSFWSYWYGADGAWQTYLEGSDTAVTAAGGIEGWRYADGTVVPQVALPTAGGTADPVAEETDGSDATEEATPISAPIEPDGLSPAAVAGIALAALLAAAAAVLGLRRQRDDLTGTDPADPKD